jgi:tetratricopeptide (TPR) repeat protein
MTRLRASGVVCLLLVPALAAAADRPAWQRQLQGDDAKKAAELDRQVAALEAAGKFAEALKPAEELLALRRRGQGDDHWQTHMARVDVDTLRQTLALPPEQQRHLPDMLRQADRAAALYTSGHFAEAEPLFRRALAVREEYLGPRHPGTAVAYSNLALGLTAEGKYAEAEPLLRKAVTLFEAGAGPHHPNTGGGYNNLALSLSYQGRPAEAEPLFRRVVAVFEEALGPRHPATLGASVNLAHNLQEQGKLADAEALQRRTLATAEAALGPRDREVARGCNSLASILEQEGKPGDAEPLYRRAVALAEQVSGPAHPDTATAYANLARALVAQGRLADAEALQRRALAIEEKVLGPRHAATAATDNGLAIALELQGKDRAAEPCWRAAVAAFEVARLRAASSGFGRAAAARMAPHLGLAFCLARQGKPADAWQAAEAGLGRGLLDDLAARARPANPDGERLRQRTARLDQLDRLLVPLLTAADLPAADRKRRDDLLRERADLEAALDAALAEQARGRVFPLERVQRQLPADAALVFWVDWRAGPRPAEAGGWHWGCVVRRGGPPAWVRLPGGGRDGAWTAADDELPGRLREALALRAPGWADLARRLREQRLDPLQPHLGATADLPAVTHLVVVPAGWMAGVPLAALTDRHGISYAPSGTVFARLAEQHRPLRDPSLLALGDPTFTRRDVTSPPVPDHGLLVVQVLPGSNAEKAGLRTDDVLLRYGDGTLNAVGDLKVKDAGDPVSVRVWRDGRTRELTVAPGELGAFFDHEPAPAALKQRRESQRLLAATRGPEPKPLPGTRREVRALAGLFPAGRAEVLLGLQASEQRLDQLRSEKDGLKDFRVLHFATHGAIDPASPARSALLLADDQLPDPESQAKAGRKVYTGRLTAATLSDWDLDADLVVLSACDTGLGRWAGGEGFLGFSQVLFGAGARSLVLSLWQVDDTATALLMTRFYEDLLGRRPGLKAPLGRAEALREAQTWLRTLPQAEAERLTAQLTGGELRGTETALRLPKSTPAATGPGDCPYAHPYYWSAFVLLGDPD